VTAAPREKVVRVSLAALRNLCGAGEAGAFSDEGDSSNGISGGGADPSAPMSATVCAATTVLIGCGLPKTLANLKDRAWADPDITNDVDAVRR
jgi:roadblock/LC7 domain-containing protein